MDPQHIMERIKHYAPVMEARKVEQNRVDIERKNLYNNPPWDTAKIKEVSRAYYLISLHNHVDAQLGCILEEKGLILSFNPRVCQGYYTKEEVCDEVCKYLDTRKTDKYEIEYQPHDLRGDDVEIVVWIHTKNA